MRRVWHLFAGALVLLGLAIGAIFVWAIEPTIGGHRFLELDSLVTAESTGSGASLTPAELPIQLTDSTEITQLALRYEPTLVTSVADRFWPVSVLDTLKFRWKRQGTCLFEDGTCQHEPPHPTDLERGTPGDYLQYPTAVNKVSDAFLSAARALGSPIDAIEHWRSRASQLNPFRSAQFYFYYLPDPPHHAYRGVPDGLISLQYWFFYPLNYLPTVKISRATLFNPIGATIGNTDYHQGDLEHVAVLLDPRTKRPRYLWMARHLDEGVAFPWHSKRMQWDGDHPVVYAAFGSHATYPRCGIQRRGRTFKLVNDYVICAPKLNFGFTHQSTPLVDVAHATWRCWQGRLGRSEGLRRRYFKFAPYETFGPQSPLRQQENLGAGACGNDPDLTPRTAAPQPSG
jgi:hypothetical protein